jgi:predicted  nucleic acid-binding Zn-ribbon protein
MGTKFWHQIPQHSTRLQRPKRIARKLQLPTAVYLSYHPHNESNFLVEVSNALTYIPDMSQTLEERVEELEKKVAELSAQALALRPRQKDWRRTVGSMTDDEMAREAERLGREYRQQQTFEKEIAGS